MREHVRPSDAGRWRGLTTWRFALVLVALVMLASASSLVTVTAGASPPTTHADAGAVQGPVPPLQADVTARLVVTPNPAHPGQPVTFDARASTWTGDERLICWFDFDGDGVDEVRGASCLQQYEYNAEGTYRATVDVRPAGVEFETDVETIAVVIVENEPPVLNLSIQPPNPSVGQTVRFDASGSVDTDGEIVEYEWGGQVAFDPISEDDSIVEATFNRPGRYPYSLTIRDDDGAPTSARRTVVVRDNLPPAAAFVFSPVEPVVGERVTFDASDSTDPEDDALRYAWDFDGDGVVDRTVTSATTTVRYDETDEYVVVLTVFDSQNQTDTVRDVVVVTDVDVESVNAPPTAAFDVTPSLPAVGERVRFDASDSTDDSGIVDYEWDFGDGSAVTRSDSDRVSHTYDDTGSYTVTLVVTDRDGATDTVSHDVDVIVDEQEPADPDDGSDSLRARFTVDPTGPLVGETVRLDARESGGPDREVVRYEWTIGDGARFVGSVDQTHTFTAPGRHRIHLRVTDSRETTATSTKFVTVAPATPLRLTVEPGRPTADEPVHLTATGPRIPTGRTAVYHWDIGADGVVDDRTAVPELNHTYDRGGDHPVTLSLVLDGVTYATVTTSISVQEPVTPEPDTPGETPEPGTLTETPNPETPGETTPPGSTQFAFAVAPAAIVVAGLVTVALFAYVGLALRPAPLERGGVVDDSEHGDDEDEDRNSRPRLVVEEYRPLPDGAADLTDEYVRFRNVGERIADLSGGTVTNAEGDVYRFPMEFLLEPDATVSLYTGFGVDGEYDLYWGAESSVWRADGGHLLLRDALGNPLVEFRAESPRGS